MFPSVPSWQHSIYSIHQQSICLMWNWNSKFTRFPPLPSSSRTLLQGNNEDSCPPCRLHVSLPAVVVRPGTSAAISRLPSSPGTTPKMASKVRAEYTLPSSPAVHFLILKPCSMSSRSLRNRTGKGFLLICQPLVAICRTIIKPYRTGTFLQQKYDEDSTRAMSSKSLPSVGWSELPVSSPSVQKNKYFGKLS